MAISKPVVGSNGITTTYHRIFTILTNVNNEIVVEITSYIDQEQRQAEQVVISQETADELYRLANQQFRETGFAQAPSALWDGYTTTRYVNLPYEEDFDVVRAYEWLTENDELLQGGEEI